METKKLYSKPQAEVIDLYLRDALLLVGSPEEPLVASEVIEEDATEKSWSRMKTYSSFGDYDDYEE